MKFSKFISYFFHPINFPLVGAVLYFLFIPKYIFKPQEYTILTIVIIGTYIFPLILLFLLKKNGLINSYQMETVKERRFPIILFISIAFIIGNWLFRSSVVDLLALFFYGYASGLIVFYFFLIFELKLSLHAGALGGLLGFLLLFSSFFEINMIYILILLFILSGLVITSRLKLKAHTLFEVYLGYGIGIFCQFLIYAIYSM